MKGMLVRVATFNIRNGLAEDGPNAWECRKALTAQVLRELNADIVGLQEVFDFQLSYLLAQLPGYEVYSVGRDDGKSAGEHCTILWKTDRFHRKESGTFWLSDEPNIPGSMTWGNRITRICSWVQFSEGFVFFNTHWDHESDQARRRSARQILGSLPENAWIACGDFNADPSSPEIRTIIEDSRVRFASDENYVGTFHNFAGGGDGDLIDHIFTSQDWRCLRVQVPTKSEQGVFPSDHYPVVCDLEFVN